MLNVMKSAFGGKKILLSLFTVLAVSTVAFGASRAFFSDEEKSTGNTFAAGEIDLKIDHTKASYNGKDCREECSVTGPNVLANPSFEATVVTHSTGWDVFNDGTASLGWEVEWAPGQSTSYGDQTRPEPARLELQKNGNLPNTGDIPDSWQAKDGNQYAELDSDWNGHSGSLNGEPALVKIYQDIPTENGKKYQLRFAHSPRPNTAANQNDLIVRWNGVEVVHIPGVAGGAGTVWTTYTYEVQATSATTRVEFEGGGLADSLGVFLDDTGLNEKTCSYVIENGECKLWPLKDLDNTDFFWKFGDVKPGDYGRNVISYHVYDNNAWLCTTLTKEDLENAIIDPEAEAGDVSEPQGELSKYMEVFVWGDDNDGVYEPGSETLIIQGTLEMITGFPLAEPPNPLIASNTKYIGIAWCFGDLTVNGSGVFSCDGNGNQNDAQTDILNETVRFYAEQSRNNPNFSCSNLLTPTPTP